MLIDTHAHLTTDRFRGRVDEIVTRARKAGVSKIISIACDLVDSKNVIELAAGYESVFPTAGIHPCYVNEITDEDWEDSLKAMAQQNPVAAIGEIGLDYYHNPPKGYNEKEWRSLQTDFFVKQLSLAVELGLPVVIHQRESGDDVLAILKNFPDVRAVLHCFTGSREQACSALDLGHYLSFTGVVTYPKAPEVREIAEMVPDDRFMVETDSPYLAPVPYRGKSNEPAYVTHIAAEIARVRGITEEEVAKLTTNNAENFFKGIA